MSKAAEEIRRKKERAKAEEGIDRSPRDKPNVKTKLANKFIKVDDKYTIEYDPNKNDKPVGVLRKGEFWLYWSEATRAKNFVLALHYALLEKANNEE